MTAHLFLPKRLPKQLKKLENWTFIGCTKLTEVTIPDGVADIGIQAFYNCSNLKTVSIPKSVTAIRENAFQNTAWMEAKKAENPMVIVNAILLNGEGCSGNVTIPNTVKVISGSAFFGCTELTGVVIPDSITIIGDSAFSSCPKLTSVSVPDSVTSLGGSVFSGCSALTEAVVPAGITEIGEYLFWGCTSLEKVQLPEGITSVGEYAFDQCDALTDVYFGGTQEAWDMVSVGLCNDALTGAVLHYGESLPVENPSYPKGDLDNDGKIDTSDIFAAMVYVAYKGAGLDSGATPEQIAAADIDGDGKVDSTDIYYMLYYVALHGAGQKVSWEDVIS